MRTVLFYRDFRKFHGGHLKTRDYFDHALAAPEFTARVAFSPRSRWNPSNPWLDAREYVVEWDTAQPDVLFLGGRDWTMLDQSPIAGPDVPIINFLQHVRHADTGNNRSAFLNRQAIRICVSQEVADAVAETGIAEGPVIVIPNGIDLGAVTAEDDREREIDLLIVAVKQPELGRTLAGRLAAPGRRLELLAEPVLRPAFLDLLRRARVTLFLPNPTEGFYLPALEGMGLGTLVVCPDVIGNRSFCLPGENAFRPPYDEDELVGATEAAFALPEGEADRLRAGGRRTAAGHTLAAERQAFHDVLHNLAELW